MGLSSHLDTVAAGLKGDAVPRGPQLHDDYFITVFPVLE